MIAFIVNTRVALIKTILRDASFDCWLRKIDEDLFMVGAVRNHDAEKSKELAELFHRYCFNTEVAASGCLITFAR